MADTPKNEVEAQKKGAELRRGLGDAFALVRSMETAKALAAYTLEDLITEQIFFLDSSQQGDGADLSESSTIRTQTIGRLQRIERLEISLFGEDGQSGLFKQAEDYREPGDEEEAT